MSDNVEYYLRKDVVCRTNSLFIFNFIFLFFKRSLYPQLTSIYDCISKDEHDTVRQILSTPTDIEQRVICTWNLSRGKRPSRTHTEAKVNKLQI
jgi:hypothetical protein